MSMVSNVYVVAKRTTPLCWLPSGKLACYREGRIVIYNNGIVESEFVVYTDIKETILSKCNFLQRGMRLGIRASLALDNEVIIISKGTMLYEVNLNTFKLSKGFSLEQGVRPLNLTPIRRINGFDNCTVFGGYLTNNDKKPVHIYKRTDVDKWEIVYTFPFGAINHVHNIIPDNYRNCLWIFTGDFDESAAIWKVTDNFKKVERVLCNDQKYRGCVCFPVKEGLIYATDAPFAQNYIYLMTPDHKVSPIREIDGSCIYACKVGDKYVFSSTVEPDGRKNTLLRLFTYMKRGAGIKDMYVHMYAGNMEDGFKEINKEKKDWLPYALQFGTFRFPSGENKSSKLYFQPVATCKHDLDLICIDLDDVFKD